MSAHGNPHKRLKTHVGREPTAAAAQPASQQSSAHAKAVQVLTATDILQPDKGPLKRPAKRETKALQLPPAERLEKDILSGRTWHGECQALNYDLPEAIPESFASIDEYIQIFEAPLFEEAREQVRSPWAEAAENQRGFTADITKVGEGNGGWHQVRFLVDDQTGRKMDHKVLAQGSIVVLTRRRPPSNNTALAWLLRGGQPSKKKRASGTANAATAEAGGSTDTLSEVIAREDHAQMPIVVGIIEDRKKYDLELNEVPIRIHPACAAHRDSLNSCCKQVLQSLRQDPKQWHGFWFGPPITSQRELKALHSLKDCEIKDLILQPQLLKEAAEKLTEEQRRCMWPPEIGHQYHNYLTHEFDRTQLAAIEAAACHLGAHTDQADTVPVVMIQGPPGTGKTHTVKGMLNVWHLVQFQRYYATLGHQLIGAGGQLERQAFERSIPNLAAKPRLLVCTPSNAAADELLERVMDLGLFQVKEGRGGIYKPNVVRVASAEAMISARAQAVAIELMSDAWINLSKEEWQHRREHAMRTVNMDTELIRAQHAQLSQYKTQEEQLGKIGPLLESHQRRDKALVELERLDEVRPKVFSEGGYVNYKEMRDNLEASLMQEAEMVFTTLSSTGRRSFGKMVGKFETVLVDEAAQATEVAALQALSLGCKRAVFVGDPQQLPATVLSQEAKHLQLERSLFERLQAGGASVVLLAVQYRMHPLIREFPSAHFYENRLVDGANVQQAAAAGEVFYEHRLLQPYMFFDVSSGKDERKGNGSLSNHAEAQMAAALFWELRSFLMEAFQKGRKPNGVKVGIITFYKAQVDLIRDTFKQLENQSGTPGLYAEVSIETVDSFQGKQLDAVILSCVRAKDAAAVPTSGVGFVSDIRRLNVAITRAKKAMWILGNASTLERSPVWGALIENARQRSSIVPNAAPARLFPGCPLQMTSPDPPPFGASRPAEGAIRGGNNEAGGGRQGGRGRKGKARGGSQRGAGLIRTHGVAATAEGTAQALPSRPVLPPPIGIDSIALPPQSQSNSVAHANRAPMSQSIDRRHGALDRRSPSPQPSGIPAPIMLPSNPAARPLDPRAKPRVPAAVPRPPIIQGPAGTATANGHADRPQPLQTTPTSHSGHGPAPIVHRPAASTEIATASASEQHVSQPATSQRAPTPDDIRPAVAAAAVQHDTAFPQASMAARGPSDPRKARTPGHAAMTQLPLANINSPQQGVAAPVPSQGPLPGRSSEAQQPTNAAYRPDASGWIRPPSPLRPSLTAKQPPASTNQRTALPLQPAHDVRLPGLGQPQLFRAQLEATSADQGRRPGSALEAGEIRVEGPAGHRSAGSLQDGWIRPPFFSRPVPPWPSGPGKGAPHQTSGQPLLLDQPQGRQQQQHVQHLSADRLQAQSQEPHPQMQPVSEAHRSQWQTEHPQQTSSSALHPGHSQVSSSRQASGLPGGQQHQGMQRPKNLPPPIPQPALHGPGRPSVK